VNISASFSEEMAPFTITTSTFSLTGPGTTPVIGAVSYAGTTATFNPASNLATNTQFTATITMGARDLAGNHMASNFVLIFTTGTTLDITAPTVLSTIPANGDTGVAIGANVTATFSEAMKSSTITTATFTLTGPGTTPVLGAVSYAGTTATFNPTNNLAGNTTYTATITTGVKDLAGNPLAVTKTWTFRTSATQDVTPPTVLSTVPANNDQNVSIGTTVTATFSEAMNSSTITALTFTLSGPGITPVSGTVAYLGTTATFTPDDILARNTIFTATITTGVKDLAGNSMAVTKIWTFETGAPAGPAPVTLGAAGAFNILAGSAVTNTDTISNPTSIEGLVGVYPGSAVSGLPNALVPAGNIHAGDSVAQNAKVALLIAYNDAMSRSLDAISLPGNLGGLTLAPGLYVNSSSSGISGTGANAILHLDAQGDPNACWIFKMGSTLITDPGTSIVLAGEAQAKNIYWAVGTSSTLGTDSIFKGNVLAEIAITLNTGVNLEGRALTNTAAVTLDKNTITLP